METPPNTPVDLDEQLGLSQRLLTEAELEVAFRRGIVHALSQLVKNEPVVLRQEPVAAKSAL